MQIILDQLRNGTVEHSVNADGTETTITRPPTALMLASARLIVQIAQERDGMLNHFQRQQTELAQAYEEIERLTNQLKEANETLSIYKRDLSQAKSEASDQGNRGESDDRKTETPGSEAGS